MAAASGAPTDGVAGSHAPLEATSGGSGARRDLGPILLRAAGLGDIAAVTALLRTGAPVNYKGDEKFTPLLFASQNGHGGVVEILLDSGADIDMRRSGGGTPLHVATSNGHPAVVSILLSRGANLNALNDFGQTPLFESRLYKQEACGVVLRAAGATH